MPQIAHLKKQCFLSFTFYKKTNILLENYVCLFFISLVGWRKLFLLSLHKGRQASKEFKKKKRE